MQLTITLYSTRVHDNIKVWCLCVNFGASLSKIQIHEKPEAMIFIYLCMILHGNDLMRMLNHHMLERDR